MAAPVAGIYLSVTGSYLSAEHSHRYQSFTRRVSQLFVTPKTPLHLLYSVDGGTRILIGFAPELTRAVLLLKIVNEFDPILMIMVILY